MAASKGLTSSCSVLAHYCKPILASQDLRPQTTRLSYFTSIKSVSRGISSASSRYGPADRFSLFYTASMGRNHHIPKSDGQYSQGPFFLQYLTETISDIKMVCGFLVEQPSQLKYIEWPSFQSTLKTAILTLVLVAVLIVALSSVDSVLSVLLALFLRRKA